MREKWSELKRFSKLSQGGLNQHWDVWIQEHPDTYIIFNGGIQQEPTSQDHRFVLLDEDGITAGLRLVCTIPIGKMAIWGEVADAFFINAAKAEIDKAFSLCPGLYRFEAITDANDTLKNETLVSLGFVREGILREHIKIQDSLIDVGLWGLLKEINCRDG